MTKQLPGACLNVCYGVTQTFGNFSVNIRIGSRTGGQDFSLNVRLQG
jgi:hypothetical protein